MLNISKVRLLIITTLLYVGLPLHTNAQPPGTTYEVAQIPAHLQNYFRILAVNSWLDSYTFWRVVGYVQLHELYVESYGANLPSPRDYFSAALPSDVAAELFRQLDVAYPGWNNGPQLVYSPVYIDHFLPAYLSSSPINPDPTPIVFPWYVTQVFRANSQVQYPTFQDYNWGPIIDDLPNYLPPVPDPWPFPPGDYPDPFPGGVGHEA